jgi:hypothetical protein
MPDYSNPNGEALQMEIPVYAGIMRRDPFFNNHPMRDRPANM